MHLRERAEAVKRAVWQAGGCPFELPALSLGEVIVKPTTMLYRNLLALETEELLRSHPVDGAVLLGGCDKTTPGLLMGAISMDLPAIYCPAGPMSTGVWRGVKTGAGTHTKKYWDELRIGKIDACDWIDLEGRMTRTAGTCNTMGTASTMTSIVDALGFTLPGASSIPAVDSAHERMAADCGTRAVEMVWEDWKPSRFLTRASFDNAAATYMALGGSTNAAVHLIALARRARVPYTLADLDRVSRTIPVLANDVDPDNDRLVIANVERVDRIGQASVTGDSIVFTPAASATGAVSFRYTVADEHGATDEATVLVQILDDDAANVAPVTVADFASTSNRPISIDVVRNDYDGDADPIVITNFTQPESGRVVQLDGRTLQYTPDGDTPVGPQRLTYFISDGHGHSTPGLLVIEITPTRSSRGPTAWDDTASTPKDTPVVIEVLKNDTDPSGDSLTLDADPSCNVGRCTVLADQTIRYTPPPGFVGPASFTYRIRNEVGQTATGSVTVQVTEPVTANLPPLANDDDAKATAGQTTVIDVLANDTDPDGERSKLRVVDVSGASDGSSVSVNADGTAVVFTARAGSTGTSSNFSYTITDPTGLRSTASVSVRILDPTAPKAPPIARDDLLTILVGSTADVQVLANDADPDGPSAQLRVVDLKVTAGSGTATTDGHLVHLAPRADFRGELRVLYTLVDADGLQAGGTIIAQVVDPPNAAPIGAPDSAVTPSATSVTVAVLGNDSDPDGDPLTIRLVTLPAASTGTVELVDNRSIRFTPQVEFAGDVSIGYLAVDPDGAVSAETRLNISVLPCTDSTPVVTDRLSEFTPLDTPLTLRLLSDAQRGYVLTTQNVLGGTVAAGDSPGTVVFTPTPGNNGGGSFGYSARNACGITRSARVAIDVNRAPSLLTTAAITTEQNVAVTTDVNRLATDDEPLIISAVSTAVGTAEIVNGGRSVRYTPPNGYQGAPELRVTVSDPGGLYQTGTYRVIVTPPANLAPIASDDATGISLPPGTVSSVSVLGNDRDPDGPQSELTVLLMSSTVQIGGTAVPLSVSADGRSILVAMPAGMHGTGTFSYRAVDRLGAQSEPAKVVVYANQEPPDMTMSLKVPAGGSAEASVYINGSPDPDGDRVIISSVQSNNPAVTAVATANGAMISAYPGSAGGTAAVIFAIVDPFGAWGVVTVNVTIV